jgi:hypothetical protein
MCRATDLPRAYKYELRPAIRADQSGLSREAVGENITGRLLCPGQRLLCPGAIE